MILHIFRVRVCYRDSSSPIEHACARGSRDGRSEPNPTCWGAVCGSSLSPTLKYDFTKNGHNKTEDIPLRAIPVAPYVFYVQGAQKRGTIGCYIPGVRYVPGTW